MDESVVGAWTSRVIDRITEGRTGGSGGGGGGAAWANGSPIPTGRLADPERPPSAGWQLLGRLPSARNAPRQLCALRLPSKCGDNSTTTQDQLSLSLSLSLSLPPSLFLGLSRDAALFLEGRIGSFGCVHGLSVTEQ